MRRKSTVDRIEYTIDEAAEKLGISRPTLYRLRRSRLIGYVQTGRRITFTQRHLDEFREREKLRATEFGAFYVQPPLPGLDLKTLRANMPPFTPRQAELAARAHDIAASVRAKRAKARAS